MDNLLKQNILPPNIKLKAKRTLFHRVFCLFVLTLFFLLNGLLSASAQIQPWPSEITVSYEVDPARCGTDGKVRYSLEYNGIPVTNLNISSLPLKEVRIYKKTNPSDSAQHASHDYFGGVDTFHISVAGWYYIGIEAKTEQDEYTRYPETFLEIPTNYHEPQTPALSQMADSIKGYGNLYATGCDSNGRIQLKIIGGRYPYKAYIWQQNGSGVYEPYDTLDILEPQTGTNPYLADYMEYYSVNDLPAGTWKIQMTDSCGNTGQYAIWTVEKVISMLKHVEVSPTPPNLTDSNIVKITAVMKTVKNDVNGDEVICRYCLQHDVDSLKLKYKFYLDTLTSSDNWAPAKNENSGWIPLKNRIKKDFYNIEITDTVPLPKGARFCNMWDNTRFHFTMNYKNCGNDEGTDQFLYFRIGRPMGEFGTMERLVTDTTIILSECEKVDTVHVEEISIHYNSYDESHSTKARIGETTIVNENYRYFFTYETSPSQDHYLVWKYEIGDVPTGSDPPSLNLFKSDTINKISNWSSLTLSELREKFPGDPSYWTFPVKKLIKRTLIDAKGCVLHEQSDAVNLVYSQSVKKGHHKWEIKSEGDDHCCKTNRSVSLKDVGLPDTTQSIGFTTISLITSPDSNRYNFEITYDPISDYWSTPIRERLDNNALIYGENAGKSITLSEPCLPSGLYEFVVTTGNCYGYEPISKNVRFGDIYNTEIVSEPAHVEVQGCSKLLVQYTGGQVRLIRRNTNKATTYELCTTDINVIQGPSGGFSSRTYHLGDTIELTVPGSYILKLTPTTQDNVTLCEEVFDYEIINYEGAPLQNAYAVALLCHSSDTTGNVYVKALNGALPFTYTVYRGPNQTGSHTTNTSGIFNINFNAADTLSCLATDGCNASTTIPAIYPMSLESMQKVWFEDGTTNIASVCEGDSLFMHALQVGDHFTFNWWYKDTVQNEDIHFSSSSDPHLFIRHGMPSGWYHVSIDETGCYEMIEDSLYVLVNHAPRVQTFPQTQGICPGATAELKFVPLPYDTNTFKPCQGGYKKNGVCLLYNAANATDTIFFTMNFANENGVTSKDTFGLPYDTVRYAYTTTFLTKVYPTMIGQKNVGCSYNEADDVDTVSIILNTENMDNLCSVTATDITVCPGSEVTLTAVKDNPTYPYIINWYADYGQTQKLQSDRFENSSDHSSRTITNLTSRTVFFVNVEQPNRPNQCPNINGIPGRTIILQNTHTSLGCDKNDVYRLYDSGGKTGNFSSNENIRHTFQTDDGSRVLLHFDTLDLSSTSYLYVISGTNLLYDSLLCPPIGKDAHDIPEYLVSNGNTMTLYFMSGTAQSTSGWEAIIQHAPSMAVADVFPKKMSTLVFKVCQNNRIETCFNSPQYASLKNLSEAIGQQDMVKEGIKTAGNYTIEGVAGEDQTHHCDSMLRITLKVTAPTPIDTVVIISTLDTPYTWSANNLKYSETGIYKAYVGQGCECDIYKRLNLYVLNADIEPDNVVICDNDTVILSIKDLMTPKELLPQEGEREAAIGDVLCYKTTQRDSVFVLPVDSFMVYHSSELRAIGVVFDVDNKGGGYAIALRDADTLTCQYSDGTSSVKSGSVSSNQVTAIKDMHGMRNTRKLRSTAMGNLNDENNFKTRAPAAYLCFYYDHDSCYSVNANFSTTGKDSLGWFLPSSGELYRYFARRDVVNATMDSLKKCPEIHGVKKPFEGMPQGVVGVSYQTPNNKMGHRDGDAKIDCKYHTSSERSDGNIYRLDNKGQLNINQAKHLYEFDASYCTLPEPYNHTLPQGTKFQIKSSSAEFIYLHYARAVIEFQSNTIIRKD